MMMFETSKHIPKTESVVAFLKIIVSFVLTRTCGKVSDSFYLISDKLRTKFSATLLKQFN